MEEVKRLRKLIVEISYLINTFELQIYNLLLLLHVRMTKLSEALSEFVGEFSK
jgi:hypothetical protein